MLTKMVRSASIITQILSGTCGNPERNVRKSRIYITKAAFLAGIARRRFGYFGNSVFDGKIGIWAFGDFVPDVGSKGNHLTGIIEGKPISVTKSGYEDYVFEKLLLSNRAKGPDNRSQSVKI